MRFSTVAAGAFYVPQKGAVGVGLGNAGGVALADDGSTLFTNPAGMTRLKGPLLEAGIDVIKPDVSIENRGSTATIPGGNGSALSYVGSTGEAGRLTPVPNFYAARRLLNDDLWVGLATTSPFGLKLRYPGNWFGRYDSIDNQLQTIDIAPTLAYKINRLWSIGAGVDVQHAEAKLTSVVPDTQNPGGPSLSTDGLSKVIGRDWSVGYNVGLMFHAEQMRVGLHYRSRMDHVLKGTTEISDLQGPLAAANGHFGTSTALKLPSIVSLGVAYDMTHRLTLLGEAQWFEWDRFKEIRVKFDDGRPDLVRPQNFRNTFAVALGAQYRWTDQWTLRSGVQFDQTPTVDGFRNTSIPDSNLIFLGFGATYRFSPTLSWDLGYFRAFFERADINLALPFFAGTPAAGTVNVRGRTNVAVDTFSLGVRYSY